MPTSPLAPQQTQGDAEGKRERARHHAENTERAEGASERAREGSRGPRDEDEAAVEDEGGDEAEDTAEDAADARAHEETREILESGEAVHPLAPHLVLGDRARKAFAVLGPGLITGAADDDPSGIGTYAQAGAGFGFTQLWLVLYMLPMMIAVQEMCGRIGLVTGRGVAGIVKRHYARPVLYGAVFLVFAANTINLGADLGGMVAAVRLLIPRVPFVPLLIAFALVMLGLEVFVPYRQYTRVLKFLALALLAYVVTGIIIAPNWGQIAVATIIPHIKPTSAFIYLIVGLLGTTISPYLFFWQASEEVEELEEIEHEADEVLPRRLVGPARKSRRRDLVLSQLRRLKVDTLIGMVGSETVAWFIMVTSGATLFAHGQTNVTSADQVAAALAPLVHTFPHAGAIARLIFAVGIVGAGLLAIPTLAGSAAYATAEVFGWREGLSKRLRRAPGFYGAIAVATLLGIGVNLIGINAIQALVLAAVINGVVAVPLLVVLLLVANNRGIMKSHVNGRLSNVVCGLTTLAMGIAAVITIIQLF